LGQAQTLLDCGCGTGHFVNRLASMFPALNITAIDIDPYLLKIAEETTKAHREQISILAGSICSIPLPENSFDLVISRLVLEHLPDPLAALVEVLRVVKPGGVAFFADNDFDYHVQTFPLVAELSDFYRAYCDARTGEGGNPRIGRQLPVLMRKAGFVDVDLELVCAHNALVGDEAFSRSEGSGIPLQLVRTGYFASERYDALAANWSAMLSEPEHCIVRELFVGMGRKPTPEQAAIIGTTGAVSLQPASTRSSSDLMASLREGKLREGLIGGVAELLDVNPENIQMDATLGDLGIDSVSSVMLRNRITNELHVTIPPADYLFCHSLNEILAFIEPRVLLDSSSVPLGAERSAPVSGFEEGEL